MGDAENAIDDELATTRVRVGLLGCGVVGGSLVGLIESRGDDIAERTGLRLEIGPVAVRSLDKPRSVDLSEDHFTTDAAAVVEDPEVDVVVELMGGVEPTRDLVAKALANGKPVITGNKALLAADGAELFSLAHASGVDLLFEAAVAGGIPFIRPLRESLAGEQISRVMGIVNGTTNYILTRMTDDGADYESALAEAQALGYAEADPTADVEGFDAAAKAAIIASIAYGGRVVEADVYTEGIAHLSPTDIEVATRLGYVVKLLAIITEDGEDDVAVRVHPTFLPREHPLASVREAFNAIYVESDFAGELMFYGRGAGSHPTGSAVVGDLVDVARNVLQTARGPVESQHRTKRIQPMDELRTQYYVLLEVEDVPGVLATVATVFGSHEVSIAQVWQTDDADRVRLVLITHRALEQHLRETVDDLATTDGVREVVNVLRVESEIFGGGPAT